MSFIICPLFISFFPFRKSYTRSPSATTSATSLTLHLPRLLVLQPILEHRHAVGTGDAHRVRLGFQSFLDPVRG